MKKITSIGNSKEEKLAALANARKNATVWYDGVHGVPVGTHLFTVDNNDAFGSKQVNSKTKGLLNLPIVAGVITIKDTGENVAFNLGSLDTNNLFIADRFHHLIKRATSVFNYWIKYKWMERSYKCYLRTALTCRLL